VLYIANHHFRTVFCQLARNRLTNALRAARDQRDPAAQSQF
jgi:hypothetical protein